MKDSQLIEKCREKLIELKQNYSTSINRPRNYAGDGDIVDLAQKESHIHDSSSFRSRFHFLLPEIEHALRRIDRGTYGICEVTGERIETKRLLAVPWTRISMMAIVDEAS